MSTFKRKDNPRSMAVLILNRVDKDMSFAEPLLDSYLSRNTLANIQDRRLVTQLVYGTLRTRNRLDWIIRSIYSGDFKSMNIGLKNILRTALFQIMFMDRIPSYAVVDEAVRLTKEAYPDCSGLINAVLRNALRKSEDIKYPYMDKYPVEHISTLHSHPPWMVEKFINQFGVEETLELCRSNNKIPPLTLRVNRLKANRSDLMDALLGKGYEVRPTLYSPDGIIISHLDMPVKEMEFYKTGYIQIQDEASQLISFLVDPQPGEDILDVCSGVGIKATHIAELMKNRGRIIALDIYKTKNKVLQHLSRRLDVTIIKALVGDACGDMGEAYWGKFDRILLDVPCSGLGTLRRNPEIRWHTTSRDLKSFPTIQRKILDRCANYLKKDGVMVYSTCTIMAEENEKIIKRFLSEHPDFQIIRPAALINKELIDDAGYFRTYPHRHGMDGFFGAVLVKEG